ncbi:MAG: TVP38/TMEM64 family protein [Christensenellaceae bacterium]
MKRRFKSWELLFSIAVIILLAVLNVVFFFLYGKVAGGFIERYRALYNVLITVAVSILSAVSIIFQLNDKSFVYRLTMLTMILLAIVAFLLYVLKVGGFWEKVDSVEDMREFVASTNSFAELFFVFLQVLQVIILPIPGIISTGAGVALFGPLKGALLSFAGIMIGSLTGFFIGRFLGYKAAKWLVGDGLDKALQTVKGKDRVVLSFMFLFPFFPDDILCFVAGMSSMSVLFFTVMITITRAISVFFTCFSISGNLIPYNTWWGITLWGIIFIITVFAAVVIYKKGDVIEKWFITKFTKKKKAKCRK